MKDEYGFFNILIRSQTYLNILYLLLSFPLGIFYFVFLVTGISLGIGLIITLFGIPLLMLMLVAWWGLAYFERAMTQLILRMELPPMIGELKGNWWSKYKTLATNPATWKGLLYLFLKFPLGIFSFVSVVTLLSTSLAFIVSPILYFIMRIQGLSNDFFMVGNISLVEHPGLLIVFGLFGLLLGLLSLHFFNGLAYVNGIIAKVLVGSEQNIVKTVKKGKPKKR